MASVHNAFNILGILKLAYITVNFIVTRCPREVNEFGCYSMKSDVASFGYLMWEVMRAWGRLPIPPEQQTHMREIYVAPYTHIPYHEVCSCSILKENNSLFVVLEYEGTDSSVHTRITR